MNTTKKQYSAAEKAKIALEALLTSAPKSQHALITSVIMILCAIFDSSSAKIIGSLFESIGGIKAFMFATIVPLIILLLFLLPYKKSTIKCNN